MRNFGVGSGLADAGGKALDKPALHDGREYYPSPQSRFSDVPAGALFERSDIAQALFDIACALVWMLLGVVALVGVGICIVVPLVLAFD